MAVVLWATLVACGGAHSRAYVQANERLFDQLPRFPGARIDNETATPYGKDVSGPVSGYGTRFDLKLPPAATAVAVGAFYRRKLEPEWQLVEKLQGPVLNFRNGRAFVSINLDNAHVHVLEIAVDHEYYGKLGR